MTAARQLLTTERSAALEASFARLVVARLNERGESLPHDIEQRLRVATDQAMIMARHARRTALAGGIQVLGNGTSATIVGSPWWWRLASAAPIVLLAAGLVLIQQVNASRQIQAAADIDAVLLADDLPPAAYSDPGFGEFLKQAPP